MARLKTYRLLAVFLAAATLAADDKNAGVKEIVRADAERLTAATIGGDVDKVLDLTVPKVIEMMGGREKAADTIRTATKLMKDGGSEFLAGTVDDPADPVAAGDVTYIVVPFTLKVKVAAGVAVGKSFLIGQSTDGGKTWKYVNGDMPEKALRLVLPDLPKELKLPERQRPVVTKP